MPVCEGRAHHPRKNPSEERHTRLEADSIGQKAAAPGLMDSSDESTRDRVEMPDWKIATEARSRGLVALVLGIESLAKRGRFGFGLDPRAEPARVGALSRGPFGGLLPLGGRW